MITIDEIKNKSPEEIILLLHKSLQEKDSQLKNRDIEIASLRHRLNTLLNQRYGKSSESLPEGLQGYLFDEATITLNEVEIKNADEEITVASHQRKKSGRKALPTNLPRVQYIHDLTEFEKTCSCGCQLAQIGQEKSEQLEFIPAQVQVIEHIRLKYACKKCEETIKLAALPKQPIPKSIATPGLLSHMIVSKVADHLPLYRQEYILQRMGIDIPRCTMSHWFIRSAELLKPLVDCMKKIIWKYDIGYTDETVLQVLKEPEREASQKSYMWLFLGGPPDEFSFVYEYHPSRSSEIAKKFWQNFKGYLHSDGYQGYHILFEHYDIKGVHCFAHARRKFFEITKTANKQGLAHWAVKHIGKLYDIEKLMKEKSFSPLEIKQYRQEHAKPLLDTFKEWLDLHVNKTPPQSSIGKAILYCLKFWNNLIRYLDDGRLEIDNNRSERSIKPFVCGRKNWLFCNSVAGAKSAAILYSLVETCKAHNIEPYLYFKTVLEKIPYCETEQDYERLLPFNYSRI